MKNQTKVKTDQLLNSFNCLKAKKKNCLGSVRQRKLFFDN